MPRPHLPPGGSSLRTELISWRLPLPPTPPRSGTGRGGAGEANRQTTRLGLTRCCRFGCKRSAGWLAGTPKAACCLQPTWRRTDGVPALPPPPVPASPFGGQPARPAAPFFPPLHPAGSAMDGREDGRAAFVEARRWVEVRRRWEGTKEARSLKAQQRGSGTGLRSFLPTPRLSGWGRGDADFNLALPSPVSLFPSPGASALLRGLCSPSPPPPSFCCLQPRSNLRVSSAQAVQDGEGRRRESWEESRLLGRPPGWGVSWKEAHRCLFPFGGPLLKRGVSNELPSLLEKVSCSTQGHPQTFDSGLGVP